MSNHESVRPLLEDPSLSAELRSVLDAATEHEPSPGDLAGLEKKLAAALPPGTLPGGGSPPAAPAGGAAGGAKVLAGLAIASAVAGTLWLARAPEPKVEEAPRPAATTEPAASVATAAPAIETAPPVVSAAPSVRTAPKPSAAPISAPPETTMLKEAHEALLHGTPERALTLAEGHARAYPRGALAQEREVIAIESLVRLGRRDEALARARSFHAAFPGSSHGERVDRLVEPR